MRTKNGARGAATSRAKTICGAMRQPCAAIGYGGVVRDHLPPGLPPDPFADDPSDPASMLDSMEPGIPLDESERLAVEEDLADLAVYEALLAHRGIRGLVVVCDDCQEDHYHDWDMLRANLLQLLIDGDRAAARACRRSASRRLCDVGLLPRLCRRASPSRQLALTVSTNVGASRSSARRSRRHHTTSHEPRDCGTRGLSIKEGPTPSD